MLIESLLFNKKTKYFLKAFYIGCWNLFTLGITLEPLSSE